MIRTLKLLSALSPIGRYRRSCIARRSICWVSGARLPTSSKNSVPPSASWKYPFLALSAPVNAPLTCPKNADGASSLVSEPQSTGTNGLLERLLLSCRWWAICSLPVPFSPNISTLMSVGATSLIRCMIFRKAEPSRANTGIRLRPIFRSFSMVRRRGTSLSSTSCLGM